MKLKITTLIIIEEGQDIYHSLEDDQDKAYQEIPDQVQPSTSTHVPQTN